MNKCYFVTVTDIKRDLCLVNCAQQREAGKLCPEASCDFGYRPEICVPDEYSCCETCVPDISKYAKFPVHLTL